MATRPYDRDPARDRDVRSSASTRSSPQRPAERNTAVAQLVLPDPGSAAPTHTSEHTRRTRDNREEHQGCIDSAD